MGSKIEHTSLTEKAYSRLRTGLISSSFRPGEVIRIQKLAEQYGISATPVREALQRLVTENAIEMQPNKSFSVPVLSVARFEEIHRMRKALEPVAAELAFPNITKRTQRELSNIVDDIDEAIEENNIGDYTKKNESFHFLIYNKSNSPLLLNAIGDLWVLAAPFHTLLFEAAENRMASNDWHQKILDAIDNDDIVSFCEGILMDISSAGEYLLTKVRQSV